MVLVPTFWSTVVLSFVIQCVCCFVMSADLEFPLLLKVSCITPVYKHKGSATDPWFYHLIAVLPTLAIVFEHVLHSQLYCHISPYIPPTQFWFIRGTGAQDRGTTLAFTAIQALEHWKECRIVSLDIRGAFDSVWWNGLLQHLWSVGMRGKAYCLLCSYLCDKSLFVVAHVCCWHLLPVTIHSWCSSGWHLVSYTV